MPVKKGTTTLPSLPTSAMRDVASIRRQLPKALRQKLSVDPSQHDMKLALEFLKVYDPLLQPVAVTQDLEPEPADVNAIEGLAEVVEEKPPEPVSPYEDALSKLPFQQDTVDSRPERSFDIGRSYGNEDN